MLQSATQHPSPALSFQRQDARRPGPTRSAAVPPTLPSGPPRTALLQLLGVLGGAFAIGGPKLVEPAINCLHKLVAYAYLQGETRPSGRLDAPDLVTQVRP